jgi:hypothetical protein
MSSQAISIEIPSSLDLPEGLTRDALKEAKRESKWAKLARSYREDPCLEGKSEELNSLIREFREEFAV